MYIYIYTNKYILYILSLSIYIYIYIYHLSSKLPTANDCTWSWREESMPEIFVSLEVSAFVLQMFSGARYQKMFHFINKGTTNGTQKVPSTIKVKQLHIGNNNHGYVLKMVHQRLFRNMHRTNQTGGMAWPALRCIAQSVVCALVGVALFLPVC